MKVSELICRLQKCDRDAEVYCAAQQSTGKVCTVIEKTYIENFDEDQKTIVELW